MKHLAVITGADGGMGSEITKALAYAGYKVVMMCHVRTNGELRKAQIAAATGNEDILVVPVELSSMKAVTKAADIILALGEPVDLLMNNAGTLSKTFTVTDDGFENTVAVNYLAPFLLTDRLLPAMHAGSRVINMVSCTYAVGRVGREFFTRGRDGKFLRIPVYSNTKLALWLFTCKLAQLLAGRGICVNAADPGIVSTEIIRMDMWFDVLTDKFFRPLIRTPRQGADTAIKLLLDEDAGNVSGAMFASGKIKKAYLSPLQKAAADALWQETRKRLSAFLC